MLIILVCVYYNNCLLLYVPSIKNHLFNSQTSCSGWKGLKVKADIISENVNLLTLVPVSAFHIVIVLGDTSTAKRSLHVS